MTQRIGAVALLVPSYEEGLSFYVGVLGFELVEDSLVAEGKRWVLVAPAGAETRILLARASDSGQMAAIGQQAGGRVFMFLHSDDFWSDYRRYAAAGVCFLEEPRHESYGMVVVFRDPFGNKWDLLGPSAQPA